MPAAELVDSGEPSTRRRDLQYDQLGRKVVIMADQVEREQRDAADGTEVIASRKGLDLAPVAAEPFEVSADDSAQAPAATPDAPINEAPADYDG